MNNVYTKIVVSLIMSCLTYHIRQWDQPILLVQLNSTGVEVEKTNKPVLQVLERDAASFMIQDVLCHGASSQ